MRLALTLLPILCSAQGMLVDTAWLAGRLQDPAIVVLHVGSAKDYSAGHIPGARLLTLADISVTGDKGLRLELPAPDQLAAAFGKLGVGDKTRVVIYSGADSVQSATRVWFTLDYLGAGDRASLLDGGLGQWRAENRPVSTDTPTVAAATFTPKPRPQIVADAAYIQSQAGKIDLIDARLDEFYSGASPGLGSRPGRIPGARHVPYTSLLDDKLRFRPASELQKALGDKAKQHVTYCHIGQQATVPYFAARLLGHDVRLYDGSYQDWSGRTELPVVPGK